MGECRSNLVYGTARRPTNRTIKNKTTYKYKLSRQAQLSGSVAGVAPKGVLAKGIMSRGTPRGGRGDRDEMFKWKLNYIYIYNTYIYYFY